MLADPQAEFQGLGTVLILEDEALVSTMMEDVLLEAGVSRVLVCGSVEQAHRIVEATLVDCAILDVWIGDGTSGAVADALQHRGIPFFFSSASDLESVSERHRHLPLLSKPFSNDQLVQLFRSTLSGVVGGTR